MKNIIQTATILLLLVACHNEQPLTEIETLRGKAKEWIDLNPAMRNYLLEQGITLNYQQLNLHETTDDLRALIVTQQNPNNENIQVGVGFYVIGKAIVNAFIVRIERLPNGIQQIDHVDILGQIFSRIEFNSPQNIFTKVELVHEHPGGRGFHSPITLSCFDSVYTFSPWVQQISAGAVISPEEVLLAIAGCSIE